MPERHIGYDAYLEEAMASKHVPPMDRTFVLNLVLILIAGMLLSFAILYYTDYYPRFTDLLGLGGALTWLAVVYRLLLQDRTDAIQHAIDKSVLRNRWTSWGVGLFVVALVVFWSFVGTIELQQMTDTPRLVWLHWSGDFRGEHEIVPPGQTKRFNVLSPPWRGRMVTLKVNALPAATRKVWPWWKVKMNVPGEFLAPVVLVRASPDLMSSIVANPKKLRITIDGRPSQEVDFRGQTLWIGCDKTVEVPERLLQAWRAQPQVYQERWTAPESLQGPSYQMTQYSSIKLQVVSGSAVLAEQTVELRPYQRLEEFPREVVLELKSPAIANTAEPRKESDHGQ
jgi:hypothetical protein